MRGEGKDILNGENGVSKDSEVGRGPAKQERIRLQAGD